MVLHVTFQTRIWIIRPIVSKDAEVAENKYWDMDDYKNTSYKKLLKFDRLFKYYYTLNFDTTVTIIVLCWNQELWIIVPSGPFDMIMISVTYFIYRGCSFSDNTSVNYTSTSYNHIIRPKCFLPYGAPSYFSKFSFLFHLKNHHSKIVNLKFQLKWSSHLDVGSNLYIAVAYTLLCKL